MITDTYLLSELQKSAIAYDLADLNFRAFDGSDENQLDEMFTSLIEEPTHNNNGTLSGKSQNDLANALRSGGWIFQGHCGTCIKPRRPRKNSEGKTIKYESPRGDRGQQLFIPNVPIRLWLEIAKRNDLEDSVPAQIRDLDPASPIKANFWAWCIRVGLPLIITEGAKKACALISAGYPAIGLNGIWGWGENIRDMFGEPETDDRGNRLKELHTDLIPFLKCREIILAFDVDENPETVATVGRSKFLFTKAIQADNIVSDLRWEGYKGADDLLFAVGADKFDRLYQDRQRLSQPQSKSSAMLDRSKAQLLTDIDLIIAEGTHNGNLRAEIAILSSKYKIGTGAIWACYQERLKDAEWEEDREEVSREIADLIQSERVNLPVSEILPTQIAGAVNMTASMMGVRPEAYLLSILTATSAAQNSKSAISICPALGWVQPPNLYGAIVAESSQRKTPILKSAIFQPFRKMEDRAAEDYEEDLDRYDREIAAYNAIKPSDRRDADAKKPIEPVQKLHLINDPSVEGLIAQSAAHPEKTVMYCRDELAGIFADLNRYRGGKGSDRQFLLEAFEGASIRSVRSGRKSIVGKDLHLSIFGGIQPEVLYKSLGDGGDGDGLWGRFLFCVQPTVEAPKLPAYGTPSTFDLADRLGDIYERIDELEPVTYKFDEAAYYLFAEYRQHLEGVRVDKSHSPILRHFTGKLQGIVARIALNIHVFNASARCNLPSEFIPAAIVEKAIAVAEFAIAQLKIISAEIAPKHGASGQIHKLIQLVKEKGCTTIREVQRRVCRASADAARSLIKQAVDLGLVDWVDTKSIAIPHIPAPPPPPEPPKHVPAVPVPAPPKNPATLKEGDKVRCLVHQGKDGSIVPEQEATVGKRGPDGGRFTANGVFINPKEWLKVWFPVG